MNIGKSIVLTGLVLGIAGVGVNSARAGEAAPSWSGFYAGANIGYGWGLGDASVRPAAPAVIPADFPDLPDFIQFMIDNAWYPNSLSPSERGVVGGGQVGYNWELPSGWVVGVEADLQLSGMRGSDSAIQTPEFAPRTYTSVSKKVDWYGTVRGRAGYLIDPEWLIYATGGLAFGETSLGFHTELVDDVCVVDGTICSDDSSSGVKLGWTLGAGVEAMLSPKWSVKAEYLYVDLGKRSFNAQTTSPVLFATSASFHENIVHVGLNYHFN